MPLTPIQGEREENLMAILALSPAATKALGPDWLDFCVQEGLHPINDATPLQRLGVSVAELQEAIIEAVTPLYAPLINFLARKLAKQKRT